MRWRTAAVSLATCAMAALTACSGGARGPARPTGTTASAPGPGATCGQVRTRVGLPAEVVIVAGSVTCAQARRVLARYYDPATRLEGSGGHVRIGDWECVSTTYGEARQTGRYTTCRDTRRGWEVESRRPTGTSEHVSRPVADTRAWRARMSVCVRDPG